MSNLSDFFGAADASGDQFTNPEAMMLQRIGNTALGWWNSGTFKQANAAEFYTGVGNRGAYVNVGSGKTADTYATILDVTGQGFCSNWWSFLAGTQGNGFYTSRVTMDGKVYTLVTPNFNIIASHRALYGHTYHGHSNYTYHDAAARSGLNRNYWTAGYLDQSQSVAVEDGTSGQNVLLPTFEHLTAGRPALRFKTGLKIEMKCSIVGATTSAYNSYAGALYSMTGDLS